LNWRYTVGERKHYTRMTERLTNRVPRSRVFLKQSEVQDILGQTVFNDASAAKWLKPTVRKRGKKRLNAMILYTRADVLRVADRIERGEYPGQKR
jgi:hypothetical protein